MKKILTVLFLFLSINLFGQKCPPNTIYINKDIYDVCYSEMYKNPMMVTYKIYKPKSMVDRKGMTFYHEKDIITAGDADFKDNVYDKGHIAAAQTFSDTKEHLHETFSYVNCAVQHYKLNRGVWETLEEKERQWAQQDSLFVVCGVIFNTPTHQLKSGAYIPDYFTKRITFLSTGVSRLFVFPNVEPKSKNIEDYEVKSTTIK